LLGGRHAPDSSFGPIYEDPLRPPGRLSFQLFGANLRKIEEFLKKRANAIKGKIRRLPSRRRTKSLTSWEPVTGVPAKSVDTSDDPDPPITA
jgi:hypothetical protein